jgi:hypothetical protein
MEHLSSMMLRCGCSCDPEDKLKRQTIISTSPQLRGHSPGGRGSAPARRGVVPVPSHRSSPPRSRPRLTQQEAKNRILLNTNMLDSPAGEKDEAHKQAAAHSASSIDSSSSITIKAAKAARVLEVAAQKHGEDALHMPEDDLVVYLLSKPTVEASMSHDVVVHGQEAFDAQLRAMNRLPASSDVADFRKCFNKAVRAFR